jgi:SAM-dependent methyltransferase
MREVAARERPSATVQPGISSSLPFGDGSFDLVMAIEVFRYLGRADVHASYAETWRVLAPGGRFFFTMVNRDALDGFWLLQRVRERFTKGRFDEVHPHCEFVTPPMVERDLRRAGFTDVTTVGRLFGPVRLVYKVSPRLARGLARRIERWDDALSSRRAMRRFGGHLICTATKPGAT